MDLLGSQSWLLWIALILIFVVIETLSLEFTFLMLALGSVVGLLAATLGTPFWVQVISAAVAALAFLVFVRRPLQRLLSRRAEQSLTNVDALIGMSGVVTQRATTEGGLVKLDNGETWTARVSSAVPRGIDEGTRIRVERIDGATAVVAERSSLGVER